MNQSYILRKVHQLSVKLCEFINCPDFEDELMDKIHRCDEKDIPILLDFLTNEQETFYMLRSNPLFVLSLLELGISNSKSGLGSFSQMLSLLVNQSLYHRAEGFYLGEAETYRFLECMMSIPNDKRKLNYNIRRIWQTLDAELEDYMDITTSFIMALIPYYNYLTRDYFGMVPSDWFRVNACLFSIYEENEKNIEFSYPTLSNIQLSHMIHVDHNIVKQFDEPVQYLLKLK